MNHQDEEQSKTSPAVIEDLAVAHDQETRVKGGAYGDGSVRPVRSTITSNEW